MNQLRTTHLHSTPARRYLRRSWGQCVSITLRKLLQNLLTVWTHLNLIRARQAYPNCRCYQLYASAKLWTRRQEWAWQPRYEVRERQNNWNTQKLFLYSALSQPEVLMIEHATDPTPCTIRKRVRRFSERRCWRGKHHSSLENAPKAFYKERGFGAKW